MKLIMDSAGAWFSSTTAALPSDLDIPHGMGDPQDAYGHASVFVFLAMFGGSTFILFLLCYFCQKKLQDEEGTAGRNCSSPPRQVYVIPTSNRQLQVPSSQCPPLPSPPPDYGSVVKKEIPVFQFDCEPPSYETAVCHNVPHIVTENSPSKVDKQSSIEKAS